VLLMAAGVTALTVGTILVLVAVVVRSSVENGWQNRADDAATVAAAAVSRMVANGQPVTPEDLSSLVRRSAQLRAVLPDGSTVDSAPFPADPFVATARNGGVTVTAAIERGESVSRISTIMLLVGGSGVAAFVVGMVGAWLYSRRLTDPLRHLAQTAEKLSTGDRRGVGTRYGIAELDAVAEVIDRGVESFNDVLEAERRLTGDASHQLRTPLTALSLRLEEIVATTDLDVAHDEAIKALGQVERLAGVSESLTAVARGSRRSPATEFDLGRFVDVALAEWTPLFSAAGRTLRSEGEDGLVAFAAPGAQSQVLATLLENSLRHGGGTTVVRSRVAGTWVVIEVTDEGTGVRPDLAPRVFDRNVTGNPAIGDGLGLTLARTLAAADGGRLELLRARPPVFALFLPTTQTTVEPPLQVVSR
jgi:signal transduction histidine kinase